MEGKQTWQNHDKSRQMKWPQKEDSLTTTDLFHIAQNIQNSRVYRNFMGDPVKRGIRDIEYPQDLKTLNNYKINNTKTFQYCKSGGS